MCAYKLATLIYVPLFLFGMLITYKCVHNVQSVLPGYERGLAALSRARVNPDSLPVPLQTPGGGPGVETERDTGLGTESGECPSFPAWPGEQSRVLSPNGRGGWTPLRPLRGTTSLASRFVHGVSGPLSNCVWNLQFFSRRCMGMSVSGRNRGLPLRRRGGQGPHLAKRWEPRGFSRVAAGYSSYDGDLSLPLGLALGFFGHTTEACGILGA